MQLAQAPCLASLEAEIVRADAESVARHLASAEASVAGIGKGAASAPLDAAINQVHHAIEQLNDLRDHLEAIQWDMESAEMDEELQRHGYVRGATGAWTCPDGTTGLSQVEALAQLDESLGTVDTLAF